MGKIKEKIYDWKNRLKDRHISCYTSSYYSGAGIVCV